MKVRVLVIDDEKMICKSLDAGLSDFGYHVCTAESGTEALRLVQNFNPHIVLTDMKLGDENGIDLIDDIKKLDKEIEVIVMTAYSDIQSAVLAIKKGAYDYINKPFELEQIRIVIARAFENFKLKNKIYLLEKEKQHSGENLIGHCEKMNTILKKIKPLSQNDDVTILIRGETGTGKELIAEALHNNSPRKSSPMVRINCSAIPHHLVESELFGFERNAFTGAVSQKKGLFEIADGGTVFLDELGELPLDIQTKLLRFLEERKFRRIGGLEDIQVDIRIIAATNKNLEEAVKNKEFREDLYYRINVVPIDLPPLRERGTDILLITQYFLDRFNKKFKKKIIGYDSEVKFKLLNYNWPGNIRELRNVIERIVILIDDDHIKTHHLPIEIQNYKLRMVAVQENLNQNVSECDQLSLEDKMQCIERQYILEALEKMDWNQTKASAILGISRFTLKRKMEKYSIT